MEKGFYHPERGYWQTNSEPPQHILDGYPEGTVEVPLRPSGEHQWQDGAWVHVPPDPAEVLEGKRATASLSKDDFILSALDLGILSEADAEQATNSWPAGWDAFFEGKPARERIEAKARWANATNVYRNAPLIAALADFKNLSPEQVDALFGIKEEME